MIVMLLVLVPLAILFAWAVAHDLKRRRRETPVHDIRRAGLAGRQDAERKSTEWGAGA
jgi:hypothetical protein